MHVIRLRKPWTRTGGDAKETARVDVPDLDDSGSDDFGSGVSGSAIHYERRFNRPTGLEGKRVCLAISQWRGSLVSLELNGERIPVEGGVPSVHVEITPQLRRHNELRVTLASQAGQSPRLSGEVVLVIDD